MEQEETHKERVERDYNELLLEIRIALPGVQVIFAFLLTVPFSYRFTDLSHVQQYVYFVALLCVALACALLLAPSAHHRIRYRAGDKEWITRRSTKFVLGAMASLIPGLAGAMFVVTDMILSRGAAFVVAVVFAVLLGGLWFLVPLRRARKI